MIAAICHCGRFAVCGERPIAGEWSDDMYHHVRYGEPEFYCAEHAPPHLVLPPEPDRPITCEGK